MADPGPDPTEDPTEGAANAPARQRGPDLLALAVGLGALAVAGNTLLGGVGWLPGVDVRWVVAVTAMLVGLLLVISSVRPRHH